MPTEPAITANDLRTRLYQLADDSMQGRRIGEPGNYKGTAYIAREFERMGLKPGGPNGSYFQNLDYGPAVFALASSKLTVGGSTLAPQTEWVPAAPAANNSFAATANADNATAVFAGRWGDTATALDRAAFQGKVAVFTAPAPGTGGGRGGRGGGRGGGGGGGGNFAAVRDNRAGNAGAAAILVVALDSMTRANVAAAFAPRMMMKSAATNPSATALGGAAISGAAAAKIFGRSVDGLAVGTTGQPISAHWTYEWSMSPT